MAIGIAGLVEGGGEKAGFEAAGTEEGLLGEGNAFQGEEFLRVDGLVDGNEVGLEAGDFVEFLEAHDGEGGGAEAVFAGVLSGAGLALRGARAGGALGIWRGWRRGAGAKRVCECWASSKPFRFEE
jgi:hypothetical protein